MLQNAQIKMQMAKFILVFIKAHNMEIFWRQVLGAQGVMGLMLIAFGRLWKESFHGQSLPPKVHSFDFHFNRCDCYESSSPCVLSLF